jgi:hypothetical protein
VAVQHGGGWRHLDRGWCCRLGVCMTRRTAIGSQVLLVDCAEPQKVDRAVAGVRVEHEKALSDVSVLSDAHAAGKQSDDNPVAVINIRDG